MLSSMRPRINQFGQNIQWESPLKNTYQATTANDQKISLDAVNVIDNFISGIALSYNKFNWNCSLVPTEFVQQCPTIAVKQGGSLCEILLLNLFNIVCGDPTLKSRGYCENIGMKRKKRTLHPQSSSIQLRLGGLWCSTEWLCDFQAWQDAPRPRKRLF